jgi:hypothetical protein
LPSASDERNVAICRDQAAADVAAERAGAHDGYTHGVAPNLSDDLNIRGFVMMHISLLEQTCFAGMDHRLSPILSGELFRRVQIATRSLSKTHWEWMRAVNQSSPITNPSRTNIVRFDQSVAPKCQGANSSSP